MTDDSKKLGVSRRKASVKPELQQIPLPRYYDTKELAQRFRRNPRTVRNWITDGCPTENRLVKITARKFGKSWSVREDDLVLFEHQVRPLSGRPDLDVE